MAKFDRFTKALAVTSFAQALKVFFEDGYKNQCEFQQLCTKNLQCPAACICHFFGVTGFCATF